MIHMKHQGLLSLKKQNKKQNVVYYRSIWVAEWLAFPASDHEVVGSIPAGIEPTTSWSEAGNASHLYRAFLYHPLILMICLDNVERDVKH